MKHDEVKKSCVVCRKERIHILGDVLIERENIVIKKATCSFCGNITTHAFQRAVKVSIPIAVPL